MAVGNKCLHRNSTGDQARSEIKPTISVIVMTDIMPKIRQLDPRSSIPPIPFRVGPRGCENMSFPPAIETVSHICTVSFSTKPTAPTFPAPSKSRHQISKKEGERETDYATYEKSREKIVSNPIFQRIMGNIIGLSRVITHLALSSGCLWHGNTDSTVGTQKTALKAFIHANFNFGTFLAL